MNIIKQIVYNSKHLYCLNYLVSQNNYDLALSGFDDWEELEEVKNNYPDVKFEVVRLIKLNADPYIAFSYPKNKPFDIYKLFGINNTENKYMFFDNEKDYCNKIIMPQLKELTIDSFSELQVFTASHKENIYQIHCAKAQNNVVILKKSKNNDTPTYYDTISKTPMFFQLGDVINHIGLIIK